MKRRGFLSLFGGAVIAPAIPFPAPAPDTAGGYLVPEEFTHAVLSADYAATETFVRYSGYDQLSAAVAQSVTDTMLRRNALLKRLTDSRMLAA